MCKPYLKCVLLAERHHGLLEGIRGLLETTFEAVVMVADANSLLEGTERLQPTVIVVELSIARNDGLELLAQLRARCPTSKVIVLSMEDESSVVRAALAAGADGYVFKSAAGTELLNAVDAVLAGHRYVSPGIAKVAGDNNNDSPP